MKTTPQITITGLDKIAEPKEVPENAPKLTGPLLSSSDVIKAAMSGKSQIIGGSDPGFVDTATRPKSSGGGGLLGDIGNVVSNAGSAITQAVKPVADKITPNTDQLNLTPNLNQDLAAPVVEALQDINVPRPNLDQDLTKVNAATVQEAVVDAGSAVQAQVVESGGAVQEALVQAGKTGQEALVQAGKATQEQAVVTATQVSGGQKNEALEQEVSNITKGVEGSIATETKGLESSIQTETKGLESSIQTEVKGYEATVAKEVKGLEASLAKEVKGVEQIPTDFANWNIDFAKKFDQSLDKDEDTYSSTTTPMPSANLDATEATGNEAVFEDIETSTTKADKLTEEERLRRIRRLMLNRYGREDTILTGAKDPMNRRRYASAL
jgi:hypothetical protein